MPAGKYNPSGIAPSLVERPKMNTYVNLGLVFGIDADPTATDAIDTAKDEETVLFVGTVAPETTPGTLELQECATSDGTFVTLVTTTQNIAVEVRKTKRWLRILTTGPGAVNCGYAGVVLR